MQADLPFLIPDAALQQNAGLEHLTLSGFENANSGHFPLPLARISPHLTYLDLSRSGFDSIPTAIMGLERLQCVNLSRCPLQIRQQCLSVLASLSNLSTLVVRKEKWSQDTNRSPDSMYHSWDRKSKELMNGLQKKLPELRVQIRPI